MLQAAAFDRRSGGMQRTSNPPRLRPNYHSIQRHYGDVRSPERLIAHYELERRLSDRLRSASRHERPSVYAEVYSELFAKLPDHPQKTGAGAESVRVADRKRLLRHLLNPGAVYLEIGCGSAALPFALAGLAARVVGLDVTDALIDFAAAPSNFQFVRTSGVEISLRDGSVDLAHSDQLMEHLHIEDAEPQLREIYRVLKPGGQYLCTTPNRVSGPHDISVYFDEIPRGFHMREYDYGSLRSLLLGAGFRRVRFPVVVRGLPLATPSYSALRWVERVLETMPPLRRTRLAGLMLGITALVTK